MCVVPCDRKELFRALSPRCCHIPYADATRRFPAKPKALLQRAQRMLASVFASSAPAMLLPSYTPRPTRWRQTSQTATQCSPSYE